MHVLPSRRSQVRDRSPVDYTATIPQQTGIGGDIRAAANYGKGSSTSRVRPSTHSKKAARCLSEAEERSSCQKLSLSS